MGLLPFVEDKFNGNDYFILILILATYLLVSFLPKLFESRLLSFLLMSYGIVLASLFDNTIGAAPFDYYDIMDGPKYTIMDVVAYFVYGPFGYLLIYILEKLKIRGKRVIFYVILWTLFGVAFEWVNVIMGIFSYKNGYQLVYSIPIYLIVQTFLLFLYKYLKR